MATLYRSMVQEEHAKPHIPLVHNVLLGQEETGLDHQRQMTEESSICRSKDGYLNGEGCLKKI